MVGAGLMVVQPAPARSTMLHVSAGQDAVYLDTAGVVRVRWDARTATVLVEWLGGADPTAFSAVLDAEIEALRQHHGTRLLADCRYQPALDEADQDRADQEWLPQALALGLKRFAVVLPGTRLATINLWDRLGKVPAGALEIAYFATPKEAQEWLGK